MADQPVINRGRFVIASLAIVGLLVAVSAWAWGQLPPGVSVPIHWDTNGTPNGFAPKEIALVISPAIGLLVTVLFWAIPIIEPRRENLRLSGVAYVATWMSFMTLVLVVHVATTLAIVGYAIDIGLWVPAAVGLMFFVLGLALARVRSNFLFGIRTPWTLSSERSWERTHRAGGPLFALFGAALVVVGILKLGSAWLTVVFGAGLVSLIALVVYSYIVWRSDPDRHQLGR